MIEVDLIYKENDFTEVIFLTNDRYDTYLDHCIKWFREDKIKGYRILDVDCIPHKILNIACK